MFATIMPTGRRRLVLFFLLVPALASMPQEKGPEPQPIQPGKPTIAEDTVPSGKTSEPTDAGLQPTGPAPGIPIDTGLDTDAYVSRAENAALDTMHESGIPRWVYLIQTAQFAELTPSRGGYVGVGSAETREQAIASAAVDFSGNLSTTVSSTVSEREIAGTDGNASEIIVESEVSSQAVMSGMRPREYQTDDGIWYALYRIQSDEYQDRLKEWRDNVALMNEAARREEMERLRDERAEVEREAEERRIEELREQLAAEEQDRRVRAEDPFHELTIPASVMTIDTAQLPPGRRNIYAQALFRDKQNFSGRANIGRTWFEFLHVDLFAAMSQSPEETSFTGAGLHIKARLVNGVGGINRFSLALGGRLFVYPEELQYEQPEEGDSNGSLYVAANVGVPALAHGTVFAYGGSDRIAAGIRIAPFWNVMRNAIVFDAAVDADMGFETLRVAEPAEMNGLLGIGFNPVEAVRFNAYTENLETIGMELAINR
jgi:hypothetical protein